jgi:hypothetical protein
MLIVCRCDVTVVAGELGRVVEGMEVEVGTGNVEPCEVWWKW